MVKMKYHYKFPGDIKSACGIPDKPNAFMLNMKMFVQHPIEQDRCKTCKKIVMDMSKKGYVGLSLMIIVDSWR